MHLIPADTLMLWGTLGLSFIGEGEGTGVEQNYMAFKL